MADLIWRNATLYARKESTEGTALAPDGTYAILARDLAPNLQRDFHERKYPGSYGKRAGVIGAQTAPGLGFVTELKGNGSNNTPEIDELLENAFGAVSAGGASTTTTSGSTTTTINVTSSTGFTVGNMVNIQLTSGGVFEMAMITAVPNGTSLTVSPALTAAPDASTTVDEARTYQLVIPPSGVNSLTMDVFYNSDSGASQYDRFVGCHCSSLKMSSPRAGSIPMWAWEFLAWNWTQAVNGTRYASTAYDTTSPKPGLASKFKIAGTLTDIHDLELDLGLVCSPKFSQNSTLGIYGTPIVDANPTVSFKLHPAHTSVAQFTGWTAETAVSLIQQFGNSRFNTWAWYAPSATRTSVGRGDDAGVHTNEIVFDCNVQDDASAAAVDGALYLAVA